MTDSDLNKIRQKHFAVGAVQAPFVDAVIRHLTYAHSGTAEWDRADEAAAMVAALIRGEGGTLLLEDPELLASLFQNADLLNSADPGGARILASVMEALAAAG